MTLHFIVNDRGPYAQDGPRYLRQGRWVLAVMPFAGLSLSAVTTLPACAIGGLLAFLGDGVILTVLKEELSEERVSRFWAFALGAAC
jgi:hypothetical protein